MGKVIWNPLALYDLQRIGEYMRETTPWKEQQFLGDIVEKTEQLEHQPHSGQKISSLDITGQEVRTLLVTKNLRVLYRVMPNDDVFIIQVLDLRSDRPFYR